MSMISDALRKALKSIPPGAKVVPAPEGLPLVVDVHTRDLFDRIRRAAANPNHRPTVIIFSDPLDLGGTRPDTGDPNEEEIRRILQEMSAERPIRIRSGTSEE